MWSGAELTRAAARCGNGVESSGRRRSMVWKVVRWSSMAVVCSCSSREEGRGEAPIDLKEMARGVSSHHGAGEAVVA
jgi:hypothetical protein